MSPVSPTYNLITNSQTTPHTGTIFSDLHLTSEAQNLPVLW